MNSLFIPPLSPENSLVKEFLEVDEHHLQSDLRDTRKSYANFETKDRMRRILEDTNARLLMIKRNKCISLTSRNNGTLLRTNSLTVSASTGDKSSRSISVASSPAQSRPKSSSSSFSWTKKLDANAKENHDRTASSSSSSSSSPSPSRKVSSSPNTILFDDLRNSQDLSFSYNDSAHYSQFLALDNLVHNMYTLQINEKNINVESSSYFFENHGESILDILSEPIRQDLTRTADDIMGRISAKIKKDMNLEDLSTNRILVKSFKSQPVTISGTAQVVVNTNVNQMSNKSPKYIPKYGARARSNTNTNDSNRNYDDHGDERVTSSSFSNGNGVKTADGDGGMRARGDSMNIVFSQR